MEKFYYKSFIGILEITCKNNLLISLKLTDKIGKSCYKTEFMKNIESQLDEYFSGKRQQFDIKINPSGTKFQKLVWSKLEEIPYGLTKNYSNIAELVGNKNAQRAVGSACNKNPIILIIPCHRVISKNGNSGGFAYGNLIKQKLLELEKSYLYDTKHIKKFDIAEM